jgi:hypothetical protein
LRVSKATSRDGGGAVEQVGVGALAAERRQPLGQRAQLRRHVAGAGLVFMRGPSAQLLAQQRLARLDVFGGGAGVGGADGDLEQRPLERVEPVGVVVRAVVADQQGVQPNEVGDLLRRRPRRVCYVPGVDGVLVVGGPDRDVTGPGHQRAQERVVAGPVEHVAGHAMGQAAGQDHVDGERLAAAALGVDQHGPVVMGDVERVQQLDGAARFGERERDPGRRAAASAHQRQRVADVAGDVLAGQPRDVAAQRQRGLPQLALS